MVFVNKLAKIIHVCTHRWGGSACKNEMGNFLLIWPITEAAESLYSMIKIVAEI